MCGILGWIGSQGKPPRPSFHQALDLLAHRGPDDRGVYEEENVLLGHRRLSIIDLSAAGHQPMVDRESGSVIVYNGELFNYIELRQELQGRGGIFRTESDTEVLQKAFLEWGSSCLSKFNGMWAFALWHPAAGKLFFARDRFGEKPFYYVHEDAFAFASEPKSLLSLFPRCRAVDRKTLYEFLALGRLHASESSFYRGIHILPPAHCGEYDFHRRSLRIWRYWDYPAQPAQASDAQRQREEFEALFNDAVRLRLRSDVPVGVSLSGGLDSTAVLAASLRGTPSRRVCFTSVYSRTERGEAGWASKAAKPYGIQPIEVTAPKAQWLETLRKISWHMDGPGYSPAVYPLWFLMKEARSQRIPVLLEGQGADEALGGYPQYGIIAIRDQFKKALFPLQGAELRSAVQAWQRLTATFTRRWSWLWMLRESFPWLIELNRRRSGAASVLRPEFRSEACKEGAEAASLSAPDHMDRMTARLWEDHSRHILPGLLQYGDAVSMAHSVESRLPFLDYRLVEYLFSRASDIKIRDGQTKWLLREYLRFAGQQDIGNRPDKLGYPTPVERWLAEDGGAIPREFLLSSGAKIHEFCDPKALRGLIDRYVAGGRRSGNHLYRLLSTEFWLRECLP